MKLRKDEVDAIYQRVKEKVSAEKQAQEKEYRAMLLKDGRFEQQAKILKDNFSSKDWEFLFRIEDFTNKNIKELADDLREDYCDANFSFKYIKSVDSIKNEILWIAPKCSTYEEIAEKINPLYEQEKD